MDPARVRLEALTSLRFFAAMAVLLYHVPFVLPNSVGRVIMPMGSLGVSFFFILSGFILRHSYGSRALYGADLLQFYRARAARILPLHYATFLIWTILFFDSWGNALTEKINSGIANLFVVHAFFAGPLFNLGYNAVSWSISVELLFYALFPLLMHRHRAIFVLAAYGAAFLLMPPGITAWIDKAIPNFFYFNPIARLLEFTCGIALYRVFEAWKPNPQTATAAQLTSILALPIFVAQTSALQAPAQNVLLLIPFSFIILSFSWTGLISRALATKPLVLLGEASFSLYLIHHMWFRIVDPLLAGNLGPRGSLAVATASAIAVSIVAFLAFERPMRSLCNKSSWRRKISLQAAPLPYR